MSANIQGQEPRTILIAEDDEDIVPLIGHYLEEEGYQALVAMNQKQLHATMKQHQPDMIIMDYNFREADGVELSKELFDSGYKGKIIMLTASSGEAIVKLAMQAGCSDFITKPIDREKLLLSIALHLND